MIGLSLAASPVIAQNAAPAAAAAPSECGTAGRRRCRGT